MRGYTLTVLHSELVTETCHKCGVLFGMSTDFRQYRINDKKEFYCPAGHPQHYVGETEAEKLKKQLQQARETISWFDDRLAATREENDGLKVEVRTKKGQLTKLKNKAKKGICIFCNMRFANLHAHMEEKHGEAAETSE